MFGWDVRFFGVEGVREKISKNVLTKHVQYAIMLVTLEESGY